jgi:hypothetical protein
VINRADVIFVNYFERFPIIGDNLFFCDRIISRRGYRQSAENSADHRADDNQENCNDAKLSAH